MWHEFREFAFKGNAFDLAVGVIIGAAFGKIVDSIVNHIIMPIIGAIFGGLDFSNYFLPLSSAVTATSLADAQKQGAVLAYGAFLTVVLNFLIIAWILFVLIKAANKVRKQQPATPPAPSVRRARRDEISPRLASRAAST